MTLYVIRHGETEWNRRGVMQGWKNSPLTARGRESARKIGRFLKNKGIEVIYASDLGRCRETTHLINAFLKTKVMFQRGLRERNFGALDGQSQTAREALRLDTDLLAHPPHGETRAAFSKRIFRALAGIPARHRIVLVVTHDGTLRTLLAAHYGVGFRAKRCETTPLTILKIIRPAFVKGIFRAVSLRKIRIR